MNSTKFWKLCVLLIAAPVFAGCDSNSGSGGAVTPPPATLTVNKIGTGSGTVTATISSSGASAGINCGTDCTELLPFGTRVTLSASPASGSGFIGWTGACSGSVACAISLNGDRQVTAQFDLGASACGTPAATAVLAVTATNELISFSRSSPENIQTRCPITGLNVSENVVGIDYRPANNGLYGVSSSRVFQIDTMTGAVSSAQNLSVALAGASFGVDFNPVADRLRVVSDTDQNYAIDVSNGTVTTNTALNPGTPNVTAAAYTNNFAGATATVLFVADTGTDQLFIQNTPASGTLALVGPFGRNIGDSSGFEIIGDNRDAIFVGTEAGAASPRLFNINLTSGALSLQGSIPSGADIRGIAILPAAAGSAPGDAFALTTNNQLISFNRASPGTISTTMNIVGLQSGEQILGVDFRPADGLLYGLGNSVNGRLYTINTSTGFATLVALLAQDSADTTAPVFSSLTGTAFGVDFTSTSNAARNDRLRVVSNGNQNLLIRVDGADAGKVIQDTNLSRDNAMNPAQRPAAQATGSAFINAFAGAGDPPSGSIHFVIDPQTDVLATVLEVVDAVDATNNPAGELTNVGTGALLFNGASVDVDGVDGFDIDGINGDAYAALRISTESPPVSLYKLDLSTRVLTKLGTIGDGFTGVRGFSLSPPQMTTVFGVIEETGVQKLIKFSPTAPGTLLSFGVTDKLEIKDASPAPQPIPAIRAIDFRKSAASGDTLYALTAGDKLFSININTGIAAPINGVSMFPSGDDPTAPFSALTGTTFGFDFNPTLSPSIADSRIVNDDLQNVRTNVSSGETFTDTDIGNLNDLDWDPAALAYSNNFSGATTSTLYMVDLFNNRLYRLSGSNGSNTAINNTHTFVTPAPPPAFDQNLVGFDIVGGHNGLALATFNLGTGPKLYRVALAGMGVITTEVGSIGAGLTTLKGLAIHLEESGQ